MKWRWRIQGACVVEVVVLEFGRYGNSLEAYILVANYLTRRIHEHYVEQVEKALGDSAMEPPQLLVTIEEAHKSVPSGDGTNS